MTLSILICTLDDRASELHSLLSSLTEMYSEDRCIGWVGEDSSFFGFKIGLVEIICCKDSGELSTGKKRNLLLEIAEGKYIVFCDDDDEVMPYYISEILKGTESEPDCIGMQGWMTTDGGNKIGWELSKDFQNDTVTRNGKKFYVRKTNHLCPVKRELALQVMFPDKSNAEDKDYSDRLNPLLKTEYKIGDKLMYHYKFSTKNKTYQ